jgi:hypothetical protein
MLDCSTFHTRHWAQLRHGQAADCAQIARTKRVGWVSQSVSPASLARL